MSDLTQKDFKIAIINIVTTKGKHYLKSKVMYDDIVLSNRKYQWRECTNNNQMEIFESKNRITEVH